MDPEVRRKALSADNSDRWAACEPLAKEGSPEAVKLLLGILRADEDLENRDHAAWACRYLPSDEAVDSLASLAGGNAPPVARSRVAYGLGRTQRPHALDLLVRTAKADPSPLVRCEAIEAMRWFASSPIALEACKTAARSADVELRACAVDSAGRLEKGAGRDIVLAAWAESDEGIRCAALGAMGADDALAHLAEAAAAKGWRLRAQAVETSLRWRRPACVEVLIGLVADETPRVACAALRALRFLSGKEIAPDAELWRAWWLASRDAWKAPRGNPNEAAEVPPDPKATRARFQGVEIESDRVAFVIDHSTSMEKAMPSGERRIDAVRTELQRTLAALPDGFRANLVTFGEGVRAAFPAARPLTPKVRQAIVAFSETAPLEPATHLSGGLLKALDDDSIDTVYLLTDGAPSCGDFVSFTRVRAGAARANRTRRIAVHTIGFGVTHEPTREFLRDLATENGGRSVFR